MEFRFDSLTGLGHIGAQLIGQLLQAGNGHLDAGHLKAYICHRLMIISDFLMRYRRSPSRTSCRSRISRFYPSICRLYMRICSSFMSSLTPKTLCAICGVLCSRRSLLSTCPRSGSWMRPASGTTLSYQCCNKPVTDIWMPGI